MDTRTSVEQVPEVLNVPWLAVSTALGLSVVVTIVLGGFLFLLNQNVWWFALGGTIGLFGGGVLLARRSGEAEPLYGTILAIGYFAPVVSVLFGGTLVDALPEPLPGLGIGDSTFFFVWPLFQLAAAVAGTVLGGRIKTVAS